MDSKLLDEPYLTEKALGDCDIELPYQVAGEPPLLRRRSQTDFH